MQQRCTFLLCLLFAIACGDDSAPTGMRCARPADCSGTERCVNGFCVSAADVGTGTDGGADTGTDVGTDAACSDCDDGNPCTDDVCAGGVCENQPVDGRVCNDEEACTANDICSAVGTCAGTTCSELGSLTCDPGRGCVGCLTDVDCPNTQTLWSRCSAPTRGACSGDQSRSVMTGACVVEACEFDDATEVRACDMPVGTSCGVDGTCDGSGACLLAS